MLKIKDASDFNHYRLLPSFVLTTLLLTSLHEKCLFIRTKITLLGITLSNKVDDCKPSWPAIAFSGSPPLAAIIG